MFIRALPVLSLVICFAGCVQETEIRDGNLPEELLPAVRSFLGDYTINFNNRQTRVSLSLQESRLVLDAQGDLLRDDCNSMVGDLKRFAVDGTELRRVVFRFTPGACADTVKGEELEFSFEANKRIVAAILQRVELAHRCDYWYPPSGLPSDQSLRPDKKPPSYGCRQEPIPFYLQSEVVRIP